MASRHRHKIVEKLDLVLDGLLTCNICNDRFKEPISLPCQHSFCQRPLCLTKWIELEGQGGEILCPYCRTLTAIPEEGVAGFPANIVLRSLQDTLDVGKVQ